MRTTTNSLLLLAGLSVACGSLGGGDSAGSGASGGPITSGFEDEPNGTSAQANEIAPNALVQGNVGGVGDPSDRFALVPKADGTLTLEIHNLGAGSEPARLAAPYLLDENGLQVATTGQDVAAGESAKLHVGVSAGVRYVLTIEARDARNTPYSLKTDFVEG